MTLRKISRGNKEFTDLGKASLHVMDGFLDPSGLTTSGTEYSEIIISFQTLGGTENGSMGLRQNGEWEYDRMEQRKYVHTSSSPDGVAAASELT